MTSWITKPRMLRLLSAGALFLLASCGAGEASGSGLISGSRSFYGSGINADDLANIVVGWDPANDTCNRAVSHRWRASRSGSLDSIRPFFQWSSLSPGYAMGDGGTIRIQLQTDDGSANHLPSGTTLATLVCDHPVTTGQHWPLLAFPAPASVTGGQLYHLVYTNVAADPKANWVSLDHLLTWDAGATVQPRFPNEDWAVLERGCGGTWAVYNRGGGHGHTPILELGYGDGASQGQGYVQGYGQAATTPWVNPKPISGAQGVREVFTPSGADRTVSAVSVRVNRTTGTSPLTVRVEKADGTLVGQGSVLVPQGVVSPIHNGASWARVPFSSPLNLAAGQAYRLVLSSPADTTHTTHVLEKGNSRGYRSTTYFADGHAEFNTGTGWQGWDLWGLVNYRDTDLQFYFE